LSSDRKSILDPHTGGDAGIDGDTFWRRVSHRKKPPVRYVQEIIQRKRGKGKGGSLFRLGESMIAAAAMFLVHLGEFAQKLVAGVLC